MADPPAPPPVPQPRQPNHGRIVVLTLGVWIAAHLLLLGAIGLPAYQACLLAPPNPADLISGCGLPLGLTALAIGWTQPWYGVVIALVIQRRQKAVAQGIFIAVGITALVFTALCFGGAFNA